ncbi:MAG TPA: BatD family protein, partial [Planctomycetota bacterium]|nr:BatD family protein [Planctomycetota bacterium]
MIAPGLLGLPALFLAALLPGLGLLAPAAAAQLAVRIDPPSGEVGLRMTVEISVEGEEGADCSLIEAPAVDGARLSLAQGPVTSSSTTIVNGRVSRSLRTEWSFVLVPERTGTLELPPFRFNCRGAETSTRPTSVEVAESTRPEDVVGLEVVSSTDELWVGQTFNVTVSASIDETATRMLVSNGLELDLPWLAGLPGMLRLETPPPVGQEVRDLPLAGRAGSLSMRAERSTAGGRPRIVFTRQIQLLATEPGTLQFPESRFTAVIATEVQQDRSFDLFSTGRLVATRTAAADARAPGPPLLVHSPPDAGRPASFTNAVGRFKLTATAAPTILAVGETCLLSLVLAGEGNLEFVRWPPFEELAADFRVFGKNERKLPVARVLELELSPKSERVTRIPALELGAFDPLTGAYEVLSVGPFDLSVSPGGATGLADLESPTEALSSFETIREELPPARARWPAWTALLPGALALAAAESLRRRSEWRGSHAALLRRRAASGRLDAALAEARDGRDLAVAFGKFLAERLDGPPAGLTADEAAQRLRDAALADELRATVGRWEAAYLGGGTLDVGRARREASELAA